jgi:DNA-binding GntR family transcriptional regulator
MPRRPIAPHARPLLWLERRAGKTLAEELHLQLAYLAEITLATRVRVQPFRRAQFRNLGRLAKSHHEHDLVVTAIMRGDRDGAMRAMREHIVTVRVEYEMYALALGRT